MFRKQILGAVLLGLSMQAAFADSYDQAFAAYKKGDYQRAMEIWSSKELQNDARALFGLGRMHMNGELPNSDPVRAVDYYTKAANLGHLSAQFNLGLAYYVGNGVTKNMGQATFWWETAANNGHGSAQYNLGALLWAGIDIPKDQATAMKWFRAAEDALKGLMDNDAAEIEPKTCNDYIARLYKCIQVNEWIKTIEEISQYCVPTELFEQRLRSLAAATGEALPKDPHGTAEDIVVAFNFVINNLGLNPVHYARSFVRRIHGGAGPSGVRPAAP